MRYTTLLGLAIDEPTDPAFERFYNRILAAPNGAAADDLLYSADNPLAAGLEQRDGLVNWTSERLRDPAWAYLADAVARCRAACGELDVGAIMSAATWDTAEAARSLGCSPANVRYLIDRGELPAVVAGGRYMLDRRAVEAFAPTSSRGKTDRVPALYLRAGTRGAANLVAVVVGRDGAELEGELVRSVDGIDELVFEDWREAVVVAGKGQEGHDRARALHVRPAHGRAASAFGLDGLEARGRWEIVDKTNNRAEAVDMLGAFKARAKGGAS
jgi:excisionase family DNA binding protein